MSSSIVRRSVARAATLLKTNVAASSQVRGIVAKEFRDPDAVKPWPYPYKTWNYSTWVAMWDDVTHRFDENTKIIVVDGPPTGNKEALAKYIAEKLDFHYMPDGHVDDWWVDEYGTDLRVVNPKVPPTMRSWDIHQFLQQPKHFHTARLQREIMMSRWIRYFDTMKHILNTGQGVVCLRSVYSDVAWSQTLVDMGWLSSAAMGYLEAQKNDTVYEFLRPHVVVWADMKPHTIIENAYARAEPGEVNSPFYTPEVLEVLLKNYKELVLKPLSLHAELLVYDWSQDVDYEGVVDDICEIDFDQYGKYNEKMSDWTVFQKEWEWKNKRGRFNNMWGDILKRQLEGVPPRDIPELFPNYTDIMAFEEARDKLPSQKYAPGFNKAMGDKLPLLFR